MLRFGAWIAAALMITSAAAGPIILRVDPVRSSANVELCLTIVSTVCDSDGSPVEGAIDISLDCPASPGEVTLNDFTLLMVEDLQFDLDYGLAGQINAAGRDVGLSYADPGNPLPPVPLIASAFTYVDVPAVSEGQLGYEATGTVCTVLSLAGYACLDTIDLNTVTLTPLTVDGTLAFNGSEVIATLDVLVTLPVDPENPDLGELTVDAVIVASGFTLPPGCPGDLTGDDRVSLDDHAKFADCLAGPDGGAVGPCECADLNDDGQVDLLDTADFQVLFEGSCGTPRGR